MLDIIVIEEFIKK